MGQIRHRRYKKQADFAGIQLDKIWLEFWKSPMGKSNLYDDFVTADFMSNVIRYRRRPCV